ncbi:MAG: hypothetical protein LBN95_07980 [Prevotellaceae bacterium]|jgi:hypothetical protein|nr:hypothetical protein [Prevotellaceae bacterium]
MTDTDKKHQEQPTNKEFIGKMLACLYEPTGDNEKMEFRTTLEIINEMSEMADISKADLTAAMNEIGFGIQLMNGALCWIVYTKQR